MATDKSFLRAIIAAPLDDLPRLVYADWLDEHGEPERAEFIRVQCKLATMKSPKRYMMGLPLEQDWQNCSACYREGKLCDYCTLCRRERKLLDANGSVWADEFRRIFGRGPDHHWGHAQCPVGGVAADRGAGFGLADDVLWRYRRGFVEEITCSWEDWLKNHEEIRKATPLKKVHLTSMPSSEFGGLVGERDYKAIGERLRRQFGGIEFILVEWISASEHR